MGTSRRFAIVVVAFLAACLSAAPAATARLIFDPDDPAFAGATVVPLTASNLGVTPGTVLSFTTVQNGVQFDFLTTAPGGMFPVGGGISGTPILDTPREGVTIDINPPVSACVVRIVPEERGPLTGVVERIGTGEKHRFASVAEMGRIIERIVGEGRADAPARRGGA